MEQNKMSYIKKEPLLQIAKELQGKVFGSPLIIKAIEEAPEEDVVEVVRCKDCKHYLDGCCYVSNHTNKGCYPRVNIHSRGYDDFCSFGERK